MVFTLLITVLVVIGVATFWFVMHKKETEQKTAAAAEEASKEDPKGPDAIERKLVALNLQARTTGVAHTTNVETIIDKCVEVHEALVSAKEDERTQMGTMTGDFFRLVDIHLPEFIKVYAKMSDDDRAKNKANFEAVGEQLIGEMDEILSNINSKNFQAFSVKQRFMEIRFSDQY